MRDDAATRDMTDEDPQPRFPSDADVALAEQLRREIEERYLGGGRAAAAAAGSRR